MGGGGASLAEVGERGRGADLAELRERGGGDKPGGAEREG